MNTYKKITVLILLQSMVGYGIAQNCDFSKNETDKFTNKRALHTKPVNVISEKVKNKKVYVIEKIEIQAKYEDNRHLLSFSYHFALGLSITNTNYNLILLLDDGSKIETPCAQNLPSIEYKKNGVAIYTYNFGINDADFMKLLKSDVTDVRMMAQINPVEFSISDKIKTSEFFNCINNNK